MSDNINITNNDLGNVVLDNPRFIDIDVLTPSGPVTYLEGTIFAYDTAFGGAQPFAVGGANGTDIPKYVLTYDYTTPAGASNRDYRLLAAGDVRQERLIIFADGDGSNITEVILDQLRDFSIIPISVQELNILDNQ